MVDVAMNMESIYHYLVNTENYRMLAHFEYNLKETPLRSSRISVPPPMTDVCLILFVSNEKFNFLIFYIFFQAENDAKESEPTGSKDHGQGSSQTSSAGPSQRCPDTEVQKIPLQLPENSDVVAGGDVGRQTSPDNIDKLDCEISKMRQKMLLHDSQMEVIQGVSFHLYLDVFLFIYRFFF